MKMTVGAVLVNLQVNCLLPVVNDNIPFESAYLYFSGF